MALRGGIDLGGTKIQAVVVDAEHDVLGSRGPTPTSGGPQDVADGDGRRAARGGRRRGRRAGELAGVGVGSPGAVDDAAGTVTQRAQPARTGRAPSRCAARSRGARRARRARQRRAGGDRRRVPARRRASPTSRCSASSGAPASAAGSCSTASRGPAAARPARSATWSSSSGGARCPCGRRGCMEAYAGPRRDGARARRRDEQGRADRPVQDHGGARPHAADERHLGAGARRTATSWPSELIDRAVEALGAGVASAVNLLDVEAVIIGGGLGVRLGEPYVERIARGDGPTCSPTIARPRCTSPRSATSAARSAPRCWPARRSPVRPGRDVGEGGREAGPVQHPAEPVAAPAPPALAPAAAPASPQSVLALQGPPPPATRPSGR